MEMPIKIVIADDHTMFRQGLHSLLQETRDLEVEILGHARDGNEAVSLADQVRPDVVIVDVSMPNLNGIDATAQICKNHPGIKVVGLSIHKHLNYVLHMFQAGAHGYILKESAFEEILEALKAVMRHEYYISLKMNLTVNDILRGLKEYNQNLNSCEKLTLRERQVLQLIAEGQGTKEIALILKRSIKTVESHRKNIMDKLKIFTVAELTALAIQEGIIHLDH
jgi:DNA-binding NarL/FixJ family response regulator